MFNNKLKTVLITGSTGGIGKEIVIVFAKNKWNLLCHYNSDGEKKIQLEKYLKDNKCNYHFLKSDFSDQNSFTNFSKQISEFQIDSLINNAGTYTKKLDDSLDLFLINFFAPMALSSIIFSKMKIKNFGRIVNISSIAAKYGSPINSMSYGCSKRALEGITKSLSREGAKYNILVNTVRPGFTNTEFHKKFPKDIKKRISMIPIQKIIEPEDIANVVYHIGSDENNFITNETITISGGE